MVTTINNFTGFETGGGEELSAHQGTFDSSINPITGSYAARLSSTTDFFEIPFVVADAGNDYIIGFHILQNNQGATDACVARDSAGDPLLTLRCKVSGPGNSFNLLDSNGATVISGTTTLALNQEHYIEIYWQKSNAGNAELFFNNVSEGSGSGDFDSGNAIANYRLLRANSATTWYDDVYLISGAASAADRLNQGGGVEVFRYQGDASSNTGGNALDTGAWVNTQETPANDSNIASFTSNSVSGQIHTDGTGPNSGPNGDGRITGTIAAAKWIFRARRTNGSQSTPFLRFGRWNAIGFAQGQLTDGVNISLSTAFENFEHIEEAGANTVPRKDQDYFRLGMGKGSGGRDIELAEAWGMILHVPAGTATFTELSVLQAAIRAQKSISAELGAGVQSEVTKSSVMQSALARVLAKAADLDSAVKALAAAQNALDALLQETQTQSASVDAATQRSLGLIADFSGFLVQGTSLETSLGSALRSALEAQALADGIIQRRETLAAGIEGALSRSGLTQDASLDSFLSQTRVVLAELGALLSREESLTLQASAVLTKIGTLDTALAAAIEVSPADLLSLDAGLLKSQAWTAGLTAALQDAKVVTGLLEAFLQAPGETNVSATIGAALRKAILVQAAIDATLTRTQSPVFATDAALARAKGLSGGLDTALETAKLLAASLDASLAALTERNLSSAFDSTLLVGTAATASLAAAVRKAKTIVASLDAAVRGSAVRGTTLSGYLALSRFSLVQLEALLGRMTSLLLGLDGALLGLSESASLLDAVIGTPSFAGGVENLSCRGGQPHRQGIWWWACSDGPLAQ
jgi:hypothetical protein